MPHSDRCLDSSTSPEEEALGTESHEVSSDPGLGYGSHVQPELYSSSLEIPAMSAFPGAKDVVAEPSRLIHPTPSRRLKHQAITPELECSCNDVEARSRRDPDHLVQEAEGLEQKVSSLRQLAYHRRQSMENVHQQQDRQYHHHALPSPAQPRSHPSNPNQFAFGAASLSSSPIAMLTSGWPPSYYQFDTLTIFQLDGVTLRTGLRYNGGEFGKWDQYTQPLQPAGQHRLDFSDELQRQQQPPHQPVSPLTAWSSTDTNSSCFSDQESAGSSLSNSNSMSSASSSFSVESTGFRRMQQAFCTQLEGGLVR
ncbi:hypothetical protein LTR56_027471 [Elasticomyces elasticus]|nr:hypothetical protein LTR56_027471 [Elasticomyces elasticus]KAK3626683.1 hypothetical protein LTR22_023068 [Elasticomyces elasticus]KAK4897453.1 hypothetical protein LTR49_028001 [Elasticomyces elasticus]